jgi:DNA-binding CsgD family transcriptional regulator
MRGNALNDCRTHRGRKKKTAPFDTTPQADYATIEGGLSMATQNSARTHQSLLTDREREIIREAARAAFTAGLMQSEERSKDVFADTEKRLRNLPVLQEKILKDRESIAELEAHGSPMHSAVLARFKSSGSLSPEDMVEVAIQNMRDSIVISEHEIAMIEKGLSFIKGDQYAEIIPLLYFDGMTARDVAEAMSCDRSTIFRQKARLVQRIAVFLYGVNA